jgi:hypothetical protein
VNANKNVVVFEFVSFLHDSKYVGKFVACR